jgi:predicted Fe-S protein YdhL (DUF1289 family)
VSLTIDRELNPCRSICSSTALGDKVCIGCLRKLDDVINWNTYTNEHKRSIMRGINNGDSSSSS